MWGSNAQSTLSFIDLFEIQHSLQVFCRHFGGRLLEGPHPATRRAVLPESDAGGEDVYSGRQLRPAADRARAAGAVPPEERGARGRASAPPSAGMDSSVKFFSAI